MIRTTLISVVIALSGATAAAAQSCPAEPEFVGHRTGNANNRAAANAIARGELDVARHFAEQAAYSRSAPSVRGAGYANLCAAAALQGDQEVAAEACDRAVEMRDENWRAYTNRGAAAWLAGDYASASADFTRAAELEAGEDAVTVNLRLSQCAAS